MGDAVSTFSMKNIRGFGGLFGSCFLQAACNNNKILKVKFFKEYKKDQGNSNFFFLKEDFS